MATKIRTINFLPEIFKTPTNDQFLAATLDQIVDQPNTSRLQGYVGSKFGNGINPNDYYVTEPTKTRTDYQLDPGVVFTADNETTAKDFISYPGILDALKLEGALTNNNNRLFESQFYSWDSFTNLDKIINFHQYYWLPNGPERVLITQETVYSEENYTVVSGSAGYDITTETSNDTQTNPVITLLRGGTYTFTVNQSTNFWIQGQPGVSGLSPVQSNVNTRDILGVTNNGANQGTITFNVPFKDAQQEYDLPGNNLVSLVSTVPFSQINGQTLSTVNNIDGITSLNNLTVLFYNTGNDNEIDSVSGYSVKDFFWTITYTGDMSDPTLTLTPVGVGIPNQQKITVLYGTEFIGKKLFKNSSGDIELIPYLSAILDTLYYQDGSTPSKVGIIKLIDNNLTNQLDITTEILGKKQYTSTSGVVFTNGLKVAFQGDIFPSSYTTGEYYVEGVGTGIELVPVSELVVPEKFTQDRYIPYDSRPYDIGNFDIELYIPISQDYITIARNSINKNAWSRSNRWFHIDVINASAVYNNNPGIVTQLATQDNKAKRPIIEFYPNLKLFNSGSAGKQPVDFIDFRTTDSFSQVLGAKNYYPDVPTYTTFPGTATIAAVSGNILTTAVATTVANSIVVGDTTGMHLGDGVVFTGSVFGGLVSGETYYIKEIINNVTIRVSQERFKEVLTLSPDTGSMNVTVTPLGTFVTVPTTDIKGPVGFTVGQYITDSTNRLPTNSQITLIQQSGSNTVLTVTYSDYKVIVGASDSCLTATDTPVDNYKLFDGARIIFAIDDNVNVRNKIYVARFSQANPLSPTVITLTEASDGNIEYNDQVVSTRGYSNQGYSFYYSIEDNENVWVEAQQKTDVNQPPLFDVVDKDNISFGDQNIYTGSSFKGSTLFSYGLGTGPDDTILGFPIRYSSIDNLGDISFDVSFNKDTFNYVTGTDPKTEKVNTGYVLNYSTRTVFERLLGWQTAVGPSVQYQLFQFTYDVEQNNLSFVCDVVPISSESTPWPTVEVYVNNKLQTEGFLILETDNSTTISFIERLDVLENSTVEVLILSDDVSNNAYYTIPINLSNNPFNEDLTTVNVGDIRGQYQSIFYNNPNSSGQLYGANNYRDLGNLVPWGNKIIQNSASLVLPGVFLRNQNFNLLQALEFNSIKYTNFKALLVDTVNNTNYSAYQTPQSMLDDALDQITGSKTESDSFFWSDMIPSKSPYLSTVYTYQSNTLQNPTYSLDPNIDYNFTKANYNGLLVYRERTIDGFTYSKQLVKDVDYTVDTVSKSVTILIDLINNDNIVINQYNQTYGSFIPNTPTKLGLYPATIPSVVLDTNYTNSTYFIRGHDGSYNKLYGTYDVVTERLVDFRDQVLLEFELRVYNNLKLSNTIPIQEYEVLPGFFRETDYSYNEILDIYSKGFLNWVGQNRIDYKTQTYSANNQYSYNYFQSGNKINNQPIEQGNWRGIYQYYFDTSNVNTSPWEMIGYTNKPTWWETRYGPAPYTSDNLVLWNDLAQGIDYNNGDPVVIEWAIRPELLQVLPVGTMGELLSPLNAIVRNYNGRLFQRDWKVGDVGPAELAYRRSSSWPFDLMRILALTKPAKFFNLAVDMDNYKYSTEFNQYLVNDRSHLIIDNIEIYGNGTAKTSYINWIVDYQKQVGLNGTNDVVNLLKNLDVRLVFRLAGFSDKSLLQFFVEKSSPTSRNSSLLIPDDNFSLLLYENQPFDRIVYSSVVVQISNNGFTVFGNSQLNAYFKTLKPVLNGNYENVEIESLKVKVAKDYTQEEVIVPYGTLFYTVQEVSQFLMSYGKYLESQGMIFAQIENGIEVTWLQMVAEFMYWAQQGWEVGSITTINPAATLLSINKDSYIVQPLTITNQNFVLNQNLYPIQTKDLAVIRENTLFTVQPQNQGDSLSYGQFNISNFEHGIVFDNVTLFNDVIYNLVTGLKQNRIYLRGVKTADWNGTVDSAGFILNQDNIQQWNPTYKYTTGSIVKFKNKYWVALTLIQPSEIFQETNWKLSDYNEIQKGLLPNTSTRSYESLYYYDVNKANLEADSNLLSFSLIGFRPREYMSYADLTSITQVNLYQNIIRNKGTRNSVNVLKNAVLTQGGIDYEVYENWAIKSSEFGGVLNNNFVEFKLNQRYLTGNPSTVALTTGIDYEGTQQEVVLYNLFNYARPVTDSNILLTLPTETPMVLLPDCGYVNTNDVKMMSFYYSQLSTSVNKNNTLVPIQDFYVRDYAWIANYLNQWQVFTPQSLGQVINVRNNLNGTVTVTFLEQHNLSKYQIFAIINFDSSVNGYYFVTTVIDNFNVIINLDLNPSINTLSGQGIAFKFQSQRVQKPSDIITSIPLLDSEFIKNTVWVDESANGSWGVYRKSINYQYQNGLTNTVSSNFGKAVAVSNSFEYLVSDSNLGKVYRYTKNKINGQYSVFQTLTEGVSFGSTIEHQDDIIVISEPTSASKVYVYQYLSTKLLDTIDRYQDSIDAPTGVTRWGDSVAISGDKNWLYISAIEQNTVYVYRRNNKTYSVGSLVIGNNYTITSLGNTTNNEWNTIAGTTDIVYSVGDSFVCVTTGVYGLGAGTCDDNTYEYSTNITLPSLTSGDNFGYSISTDYYGDTLVVSAPTKNYDINVTDWGYTYVFDRTIQNIIVYNNSVTNQYQTFNLAFNVGSISVIATAIDNVTNEISCISTLGLEVGQTILFYQNVESTSNISSNVVYYIQSVDHSTNKIKISLNRGTSAVTLGTMIGSMTATVQTVPLYVSKNGVLLNDNQYSVVGNVLYVVEQLSVGDTLNVSGNNFVLLQTLTTDNIPRSNVQFGLSVDTNRYASEIIVGAPYEIDSQLNEGFVYRYTNNGANFGTITGIAECQTTVIRQVLINGILVTLPAGNATDIANSIVVENIPNVTAYATADNKLVIELINKKLAMVNDQLIISVLDSDTLDELGIEVYIKTQTISCPHLSSRTGFGTKVKFNENQSFVVSAPISSRYSNTTFDFSDDENSGNDTLFDNNTTQWIDEYPNSGSVYMFDYLKNYNESLTNIGKFVYAQSVNMIDEVYGEQPLYGTSIDFNKNDVIVGTPDFLPNTVNGKVVIYNNISGVSDWSIYRQSQSIVDISKIQNAQIFSSETNNTLINLDYFDPLQGKLLGAVRENLDVISSTDPAGYNRTTVSQSLARPTVWGNDKVGTLWFDTTQTRFLNYHQNENSYNAKYWGAVFPGSNVTVYSWISSDQEPALYQGPGTPYDVSLYTTEYVENASGELSPVYFFWARNTNIIFTKKNKTLADSIIESYIRDPKNSGISYFAPLLPNMFALYNCQSYINANDSVFHIGYATNTNDDPTHSQYDLIRANYPDDFLPGLPTTVNRTGTLTIEQLNVPQSLYDRLLDSLSGVDETGQVVPNPWLPKAAQIGISARPRQSFFVNRLGALKNYLTFANDVLAQYPITEIRRPTFLDKIGPINPSNNLPFYVTPDYWEYIDWWKEGYDNNTKPAFQVPLYADLATLNVSPNTIVRVTMNGDGKSETYILNNDFVWERIGLQNGTIRFKASLWDYSQFKIGFGDNFFDTVPFDQYPSEETRYIVRALNEQIYTKELLIYRNTSLILLFEYIQSEAMESQNYLPWLNKTSFIDVSHKIRELVPLEVYQNDNQDFLSGYINEVKPYHVVIREFLFKYTGEEVYEGDITDFDLPAQYNTNIEQYVSPVLVYSDPSQNNEYLPDSDIWQNTQYNQWRSNYGLSLVGQNDYPITTLQSYISLNSNSFVVDNVNGLPINGTLRIYDRNDLTRQTYEIIGYANVDRNTNIVSNLTRGLYGTQVQTHIPGSPITIDLPAVVVLDSGRGYTETPKVTAYIDTSVYPEPTVPAILQATMSLDSVLSVEVINPGQGYAVQPEIIIDSSISSNFTLAEVSVLTNTIDLFAPDLVTGDLVQYKVSEGSVAIGGLVAGQWYYVNLLESTPTTVIALYTNYTDCLNDNNRVILYGTGSSSGHSLNLGARAFCVTSSSPVRENNITLRFDRTTYRSQVKDWVSGSYYGSFFAGEYTNKLGLSSSSVLLASTQPNINNILASAGGVSLEITDVENEQTLEWSSLARNVESTNIIGTNIIRLSLLVSGSLNPYASGSTAGFYKNMPVKFTGNMGLTNIVANQTYYVNSVVNDTDFTISQTIDGTVFTLGSEAFTSGEMSLYTGSITNTAVVGVNYPGILTVTNVYQNNNSLLIPLNPTGTGGTKNFYVGLPIFFTGNVFNNIRENVNYFVTTVIDNQRFTMSSNSSPVTTNLTQVESGTNKVYVESTSGFNTGDSIIVNNISFDVGYLTVGQEYKIVTIGTTDYTQLGASTNTVGEIFTATNTGTVSSGDFVVGLSYTITTLGSTDFTLLGATSNEVGVTFVATDSGLVDIGNFVTGKFYTIETLGDANWNSIGYVGVPTVGGTFAYNGNAQTGTTGSAIQGNGQAIQGNGTVTSTAFYPNFGGIVSGTVYYIVDIVTANSMLISLVPNGTPMVFAETVYGQGLMTNQKDVVTFEDQSGTMTVNVSLPVSPGQLNGQKFTFFESSNQYVNQSGTVGNLLTRQIAATLSTVDQIAIPVTSGITNMYVNMPITVSENVGNLVNGTTYYITEIGNVIVNVTETYSSNNTLVCDDTSSMYVDMPIVFNGTSLGSVNISVEYFVKEIVSSTEFKISDSQGGNVKALTNSSGNTMIGYGSYFIKVSEDNPFTFPQVTTTLTNSITNCTIEYYTPRTVSSIDGSLNTITLDSTSGLSLDMGILFTDFIVEAGYFVVGQYYTIVNPGTTDFISLGAENNNTGTVFLCNGNVQSGTGTASTTQTFGNLILGKTYYIDSIVGNDITVTDIIGGSVLSLTTAVGTANGYLAVEVTTTENFANGTRVRFNSSTTLPTGLDRDSYYVRNSTGTTFNISRLPAGSLAYTSGIGSTVSASIFNLTPINIVQVPTANPQFDVSYVLGGYSVIVADSGMGMAVDNTITISGANVGGVNGVNDVTVTVNSVNTYGNILSVDVGGTPAGASSQYYVKVISGTQFEVYNDGTMIDSVSGLNFPYVGDILIDAISTDTITNTIEVSNANIANYTPVTFTGYLGNSFGGLFVGQTYYVVPGSQDTINNLIQVSETPNGSVFDITNTSVGNYTMAIAGDNMLLPQPFTFNQDIVSYNNKVYICVVSNNDDTFVLGKWQQLNSDDRRLNSMDRVMGYYQPTNNMPGKDLSQLFEGVEYPNTIYKGNLFEPNKQYSLDTNLKDKPFYPVDVNLQSITYAQSSYVSVADTNDYTTLVSSVNGNTWSSAPISKTLLNSTDIIYENNTYIITTQNNPTPLFKSVDGINYTGTFDYIPFNGTAIDKINITVPQLSLNSVGYRDNVFVAVGNSVITSSDTVTWTNTYQVNSNVVLNGVTGVDVVSFNGFVAVGNNNSNAFIIVSNEGNTWYNIPTITNKKLNSVTHDDVNIIAVGDEGVIYLSNDGINWSGVNESTVLSVNGALDFLIVSSTIGYNINDVVYFNEDFDVITANTPYYVVNIPNSIQIQVSLTLGGSPLDLNGDSVPADTFIHLERTDNLNDVIYANNIFMAVGDNGLIRTSINGINWNTCVSNTVNNLNGIVFNEDTLSFMVVGDSNTIIETVDNGVNWQSKSVFADIPTTYDVQGEPFMYGYAPEELVAGTVYDNLTMIVSTRPGTSWPVTEYQHVGYRTVSVELTPTTISQTTFSFKDVSQTPQQLRLAIIDGTTELSTTLYETEYVVDWVNETVTLNSSLATGDKLRIDIFETGNGNQLVRASTQTDPITLNTVTKFNEIYLNANYSASEYLGSGIIVTDTQPKQVIVYETNQITNQLYCEDIDSFILNEAITFQGNVFGNIVEDTVYYVKTISRFSKRITVSDSLVLGIAGATFELSDGAGEMICVTQSSNDQTWTTPVVLHNGNKLLQGTIRTVTGSKAINNTIVCTSTSGLTVQSKVVFSGSDWATAAGIIPNSVYHILSIIDSNEFQLEDPTNLGNPLVLPTVYAGGSVFVTNDYAIGIAPNGITALLVLSGKEVEVNAGSLVEGVSYTILTLGDSDFTTSGANTNTVGEIFVATNSGSGTGTVTTLSNYTNDEDYITYTFMGETTPQYGYTLPENQLFTYTTSNVFSLTNYVGQDNPTNSIVEVNGVRLLDSDYTIDSNTNQLTITSSLSLNDTVSVTTYNNTERQYFNTQYNITGKKVFGISDITVDSSGVEPIVKVTTSSNHNFITNDLVRIDGVEGSTQLNNNLYYVQVLNSTQFYLYSNTGPTNSVSAISGYLGGGYVFSYNNYVISTATTTQTIQLYNTVVVPSTDNLVVGTPIIFTQQDTSIGTVTASNIVIGDTYYVLEIVNSTEFTISEEQYGSVFSLSDSVDTLSVSQWEQVNVDRLYVTVNGLRVPSSKLRLNSYNELSILHEIDNTDSVTITSMMPTATPNEEVFMLNVSTNNVKTAYRANTMTKTWLTQDLSYLDDTIYVQDVTKLTDTTVEDTIAPAVDISVGAMVIGLNADKNILSQVIVYNNTTSVYISSSNVQVKIVNTMPVIYITNGATPGDSLTITCILGNTIYINGEQIKFFSVDLSNNTLSNLQRGANNTGEKVLISKYTEVYSLLETNVMTDENYNNTWNSYVYNSILGDPLQISVTQGANFLKQDIG